MNKQRDLFAKNLKLAGISTFDRTYSPRCKQIEFRGSNAHEYLSVFSNTPYCAYLIPIPLPLAWKKGLIGKMQLH